MTPSAVTLPTEPSSLPPLCVDLDGTLIATDLVWESIYLIVRQRPWLLPLLPLWRMRGKAAMKERLARAVEVQPERLPYRPEVLRFLEQERAQGREIVLATGADRTIAERIAAHVGVFSSVLASDGTRNLTGATKLTAVNAHLEGRRFHYVGNGSQDLPLWRAAEKALMVDAPAHVVWRAGRSATVLSERRGLHVQMYDVLQALRLHQWSKNLLLFATPFLAHRLGDPVIAMRSVTAFIAFGLVASGGYVLNDLLDLSHDRAHPRKRARVFAAGRIAPATGAALVPALLAAGLLLSLLLPLAFAAALLIYLASTLTYSVYLKRHAIIDVFTLGGLYTLRVWAGALAASVAVSPWLAAFSLFFFTSLAFLKRYGELRLAGDTATDNGRGYQSGDADMLRTVGIAAGYASVLVLALYLQSEQVVALYEQPAVLWLVLPLVLFWVTHVWFAAHHCRMHDDPIVFTARDRTSWAVGAMVAAIVLLGAL